MGYLHDLTLSPPEFTNYYGALYIWFEIIWYSSFPWVWSGPTGLLLTNRIRGGKIVTVLENTTLTKWLILVLPVINHVDTYPLI